MVNSANIRLKKTYPGRRSIHMHSCSTLSTSIFTSCSFSMNFRLSLNRSIRVRATPRRYPRMEYLLIHRKQGGEDTTVMGKEQVRLNMCIDVWHGVAMHIVNSHHMTVFDQHTFIRFQM